MKEFMEILTFAAVLGSALVAGIFFAFSTFVMRALGQLPESQGIAAMKAINVTVLNPWFFLAFFGTGMVCLTVAFLALGSAAGTLRAYLLAGCALYLLGCLLVTVAFNVPLNDRLASAGPDSSGAEALWANYLSRWTFWNHVRTAASLAAAGLFAMAFCGGKCASEQRTATMEVTEEVIARAELLIRKPAAQVFQAFVDPNVTTKFWFDKSTVQRFGGALNLNVHFHSLVLDGVYDPHDPNGIRFRPLPPPDQMEVARVAVRVARSIGNTNGILALAPQDRNP